MIDYQAFLHTLDCINANDAQGKLTPLLDILPKQIARGLDEKRYGDLPQWKQVLEQLPQWQAQSIQLDKASITITGNKPLNNEQHQQLTTLLKGLHPWRKGPFNLFGVNIDTEWQSHWKWDRLIEHIEPLNNRNVLDVGCSNGYHCWRMRGVGANLVMGIDPTPLFITQFFTLQHYIQDPHIAVLPMGIEHLPDNLQFFDTIFSMGILYHRRSPFEHLFQLRNSLRSGGQLVLETLVIDGNVNDVLVPEGRYACMGNVWFLPSCAALVQWLKKAGFVDIQWVDTTMTSIQEQRSTPWMTFHSLPQFLDPENANKTIEGYPAPQRAIITAKTR